VEELPATTVVDRPDGMAALDAALVTPDRFAWLVVTSPNGASRLARALGGRSPRPALVAAVGPGTAEALAAAGLPCDLVAAGAVAESLLDAIPRAPQGGAALLVAHAAAARPVLVDGLAAKGWDALAVACYEAVPRPADPRGAAVLGRADAIAFAAGSAVRAVVSAYGAHALPRVVVCMGPITAAAAREAGIEVTVVADPHTLDGLVAATIAAFAARR
jgi:uroporphyrinogen-III synthase